MIGPFMTLFDKSIFQRTLSILALRVPASTVGLLRSKLSKEVILTLPRIKAIIKDSTDESKRLILLNESFKDSKDLIPVDEMKVIESFEVEVIPHKINLDYDYLGVQEVLSDLLPKDMEIPTSFETVGHLAHVNLREEHLPYKYIIGQVLLDKNKNIRTVVNKVGTIDSVFRFFNMEIIAGENDTVVEVHEEGCHFKFDYAKVYWNSRLHFEHRRLVHSFDRNDNVCDMFCGVGPFALPAAKRGCTVYANDLNPESVKWLKGNIERNKLLSKIHSYNMDAREFVAQALKDLRVNNKDDNSSFKHFIMNLPASAHEFLDIFPRLISEGLLSSNDFTIHCYMFCKVNEDPADKVQKGLGLSLSEDDIIVKRVRDVAPNKEMFCASIRLSDSIFDELAQKSKRFKMDK